MEIEHWTDGNGEEYLVLLESDTLKRKHPQPTSDEEVRKLVSEYHRVLHQVALPFWELETGVRPWASPKKLGVMWVVPANPENEATFNKLKAKALKYEEIVLKYLERIM